MPSLDDDDAAMARRLAARAYRQAATMYAHRYRGESAASEPMTVIFGEMQIEDDWMALASALADIGCTLAGIDPAQVSMYLDRLIQDAMLDEGR